MAARHTPPQIPRHSHSRIYLKQHGKAIKRRRVDGQVLGFRVCGLGLERRVVRDKATSYRADHLEDVSGLLAIHCGFPTQHQIRVQGLV